MKKLTLLGMLLLGSAMGGQYMTKDCANVLRDIEGIAIINCVGASSDGTCSADAFGYWYSSAYNSLMSASCFSGQ